jgi:murein tripeptide amidase MpaA
MKKALTISIISLLCVSVFSILTPKVMGWASSLPSPLHGNMAYDALEGTSWSILDRAEIALYACYEGHIVDYYHRVEKYQTKLHEYHTPGHDDECKCFEQGEYGGAEDGAHYYIQLAQSYGISGNKAEALRCLGYAIHFIQDSVCPPHVLPFSEHWSDTAHWAFEEYTADSNLGYGTIWNNWKFRVTNAPEEQIYSAEDLRQKVVMAADEVCDKFEPPPSGFGYVRQDGQIIGDLSGTPFGWKMSNDDIGWCMERAAKLVKGAATWVHAFAFDAYHSYSDIELGLRSLESSGIAKVESIGSSVEGRQIWAIKISDEPGVNDHDEPDILFAGLHHAREWISAEVPYYLAVNLVQNYDSDSTLKALIDNSEIWIVPVVNPDGLEYSRTQDRDWRKNRRDNGDGTFGVDLNRNYGYQWGLDSGSSGSTGAGDYRGPSAFSEPETVAIRDLISNSNCEFQAVVTYHSYSQLILYPWGYTSESAANSGVINTLATQMADLIHGVYGVTYTPQQASQLYLTSGDLTDWVYGTKQIPALTIEVRPESANPGFLLPENEILLTCGENWPAALYLMRWTVLSQGGFMDFENEVDGAPIRSTIPGMTFITTMGYDWIYGDIRTGQYNVNPYGSRAYECHGNFFAWLGPNQGSGRIDFTGATAKSMSMLTSTAYGTYLDAYDSSGNLLAQSYAGPNIWTGTMSEIKVTASNIAYVIVHDTGNYWLIDDLRVRDLLRETSAFQAPQSSSVFQTLDTIDSGATSTYHFTVTEQQVLNILLNWKGSTFGIQIIQPDGTVFTEMQSENPPIRIVVPRAEPGTWTAIITAIDAPYDDYPFALDVASLPLPSDVEPPTTTLEIGSPKYTDSSGNTYISSVTPFTLTAEDNPGGTDVASTSYRIYNATHDSGWLVYSAFFHLTGLSDGAYSIDYYSTDNIGNVEPTNTATVILDNTPSATTQTIGEPKYVSDKTYVTPDTPFTLEATDTGSGVYSIAYRIYNATYDSGWQTYTTPFKLTSLADGTYTIEYNSTDNVQNIETSHTAIFTLFHWNYIYQDTYGRGTTLKINLAYKFFQFIRPDKDYGIRIATYMKQCGRAIIISHCDKELRLITVSVDTKIDFCYAMAWDLQARKCYPLIDKAGIE